MESRLWLETPNGNLKVASVSRRLPPTGKLRWILRFERNQRHQLKMFPKQHSKHQKQNASKKVTMDLCFCGSSVHQAQVASLRTSAISKRKELIQKWLTLNLVIALITETGGAWNRNRPSQQRCGSVLIVVSNCKSMLRSVIKKPLSRSLAWKMRAAMYQFTHGLTGSMQFLNRSGSGAIQACTLVSMPSSLTLKRQERRQM